MEIRPERREDYAEVENLTREAFWNVYRPGCDEHLVLHRMRTDASFVPELDYVIVEDGRIVANIVYAHGRIELDGGGSAAALLFGPISVLPEYQRKGYGSRIITFTLDKARQMGYPAVVITGNPAYYSRFGFETASAHGIFYSGLERSEAGEFFMVKIFDEAGAKALRGTYFEPDVYVAATEDVEEFDRAFPPKVKQVLPGQLHS